MPAVDRVSHYNQRLLNGSISSKCDLLELRGPFTDLDRDGDLLLPADHDDRDLGVGSGLADQANERGHSVNILAIPLQDHVVAFHASGKGR